MPVHEWEFNHKPGEVCWVLIRIIKCRVHWFTRSPGAWTRDMNTAWGFKSREEAWAFKNELGQAFLLIHGGDL